jgi:hypothetical protein
MIYDHKLQGTICHRLHVFGIPPVWHRQFSASVDRWVHCSGKDWTVKRLKSLKVDLYRVRSGLKPLTPAATRKDGTFRGVIGSLFRYANKSERNFQSVIYTLMVYSLFKHEKITQAQQEKWVAAVTCDNSSISDMIHSRLAIYLNHQFKGLKLTLGLPRPIITHRGSMSKRAPLLDNKSVPQGNSGLAALGYFSTGVHYDLWRRYSSLYSHVSEGVDIHSLKYCVNDAIFPDHQQVWGGNIAFLQEPGLKLRAIASPYLVHQEALRPLGMALYSFMKTLPWDCTHDQNKPVSFVQAALSSKRTIHSVDLSNATDYFPLELQLRVLQTLIGHHQSIDLFSEISRSLWKSPIGNIRWTKGQPLGLYPSFAAFGLTHGILLASLLRKEYEGEFFVVGDDVVILDDSLYAKYIELLDNLRCPYSPDKSLSSNELCEFAGKIITSTSVLPSYKWRELSDDNFIDIVRNYGRRAVSLLSSAQREVVDKVKHLTLPIGLNWSFEGSNLEVMTRNTLAVYKQIDRDEQSLTELYSTMMRNFYSLSEEENGRRKMTLSLQRYPHSNVRDLALVECLYKAIDTAKLQTISSTFDEKVTVTLKQVFPEEWVTAIRENSLLGGYAGVPRAVGLTNLPLATMEPGRATLLDRLRRILDL